MDYPKQLIDEATRRIQGYHVEGFVAGQGPMQPKLMLVGEAPGKTEIENHIPFSGQAGKELMNALQSVGLSREEVYITSAVRSRPYRIVQRINGRTQKSEIVYPNRTPSKAEVFAHAPILDYELQHVRPQLIATLGNIGLQRLLGKDYTISKNHGKLYTGPVLELNQQHDAYQYSNKQYKVLPLFHPAAIFYNRTLTDTILADWQTLGELLHQKI
ncbi:MULTISPECIES: uracil-DNA glycosylase [Enterococcus]|uniref:Uracil-DNA glycosylase n=1 Tax=Candidatus Enterococcus mangumiae TaxID=2230878 RepID=A0ABZ2SXX8_9ENTE|nr:MULTISPECIES: uracil-DNA glycosylase [unclassified Enterococcus]MBO0461069.1 uracil-DNA glycosylase [Enterococcus sp. DIV1298c]MBO0490186.1 uracil-DNA glycosylase [Enterococcus sp. DIV1094]MBO1298845.1 uracil-DNA glycosylase [Enterococcus sp. DIV1271a]